VGLGNGLAPLPETPTDAEPGSPEKVEILEARARHRVALWHPLDRNWFADLQPRGRLFRRALPL
jgi:hypothetical protein